VLYEPRFTGFNRHPDYEGTHAILGASNYHWVNYDEEKLEDRLTSLDAARRGTRLHSLGAENISNRVYLCTTRNEEHLALAHYVNDAIDFDMTPEQVVKYTENCFGTADAIGFSEEDMFLRVHDYKSGISATSEKQLYVYAAYFCLEYGFRPYEMNGELRIYQFDGFRPYEIDRAVLAKFYDTARMHHKYIVERNARRGVRG